MSHFARFLAVALGFTLLISSGAMAQDDASPDATADTASPDAAEPTANDDSAAEDNDADTTTREEQPINPELKALWDLKVIYEEACNEGDPAKLKPHLDPDFTGVMVTHDTVSSYQDIEEYWSMIEGYLGENGTYKVTVNLDEDALTDGKYALAYGTTEDSAVTSSGTKVDFSTKWTAVCRKNDAGEWKIWRIHGSMNPFDNPFTSAGRTMTISITAIAAGLIGLLIGFAGAKMIGSKSS